MRSRESRLHVVLAEKSFALMADYPPSCAHCTGSVLSPNLRVTENGPDFLMTLTGRLSQRGTEGGRGAHSSPEAESVFLALELTLKSRKH